MAATYEFCIGGVIKTMRRGWSLDSAANSRDTLQADIVSSDASYRPASGAVVVFSEKVAIATSSNANPTHIVTAEPHGIVTGQTITVAEHSVGGINRVAFATRVSATEFTIPVASTGGSGGTVARRLIGGRIETPSEAGLGGVGMVPISTHIEVVDYNAQAETRTINEVLAAGTLASQLQRICTIFGWTLHPNQVTGPTMAALPCDYASARSVLDALSTATQYPWEKDEWDRLRMFQPASEAAPVDLIEGNDVTDGDIQVAPSRQNYFNRIVLRFSNDAIASWAYLATTGNFTSGETVTIGSQVYQFRAVLSAVAGYVLLGADVTESLGNLAAAVIGGAGAGTAYAAATPVNASAEGYVSQYGTWLTTRALTPGAAGNAIACASTALNAMWIWEGGGATPTLGGGADKALTNVAIAEDAAFATDPRELVVQSPETTSRAAAETLAANVLAVKLIQPKTVRYVTYALGLRPGQTQTACVPKRNLNGTIVITNVSTDNPVGNLVRRVVTAVTGGVVQAAERFQDTYRQWSGSVSGNQASVSGGGGGGGGGGTATPSIIGLGGSTVESWPAPVSNGLVAANATQVLIDTARRGSTVGTCYARMRTTAGTVTAYLWNVTTSSVVGTSVPVTTAFDANGVGIYQTVSFGVSLTPGADLYEIRLSGSVSGADLNLGYGYVE